jgi:hypothetical protein
MRPQYCLNGRRLFQKKQELTYLSIKLIGLNRTCRIDWLIIISNLESYLECVRRELATEY